ncbi:hypothetical protein QYM36_019003 [Artemia franciscana]|uniref:Uncharacterized protein n=1 Tax=Artemia franciscana TaxID=6661 RepID=A0AA88KTZ5_ARTSF|nr:hypothetical protein QYM36_019003 [Artemia franciscana]
MDNSKSPHCAKKCDQQNTIKCRINIKEKDNNWRTYLHNAASHGRLEICEDLIDKGADIDAQDYASRTPLFYAVRHQHLEVAEHLLKKDANPNLGTVETEYTQVYKITSLHVAAFLGNLKMCKVLIKYGANKDAKDSLSKKPVDYAIENSHAVVVKYLSKISNSAPYTKFKMKIFKIWNSKSKL